MATTKESSDAPVASEGPGQGVASGNANEKRRRTIQGQGWRKILGRVGRSKDLGQTSSPASTEDFEEFKAKPEKWSMGILNDRITDEVPGRQDLLLRRGPVENVANYGVTYC